MPALITNCSNNYGPYQHPEKLIPLMIIHALEGKPLPVYGDGSNVRDWLHVSDHCDALINVIERGRVGETYNIGGGNERNNRDVVGLICDVLDRAFAADATPGLALSVLPRAAGGSCRPLISFVTDRPGHDHRYAINAANSRPNSTAAAASISTADSARPCNGISITRIGGATSPAALTRPGSRSGRTSTGLHRP